MSGILDPALRRAIPAVHRRPLPSRIAKLPRTRASSLCSSPQTEKDHGLPHRIPEGITAGTLAPGQLPCVGSGRTCHPLVA